MLRIREGDERRRREKAPAEVRTLHVKATLCACPYYSSNRFSTKQAFCPPSPNELDMVTSTSASRATLGT